MAESPNAIAVLIKLLGGEAMTEELIGSAFARSPKRVAYQLSEIFAGVFNEN
ncbi:hypothetical protein [Mesorhizobium sp. M1E.F.Ca.ET.041.01.1.1]|uniref:hypothetical protein n=1 Tax=Mesorhizobium sp. M1E.F.Ca.ET.041.01.1.1 TaxID=2496759 RepID=UPI001674756F|nr:hypothetical protein [Mesorhizobium sp. M1E.F.Ca.ET.041.01.1.1]